MIALLKYCFSFTKKLILVAAVLSLVICLFGYFIEKDKPKIAHDPIAESRKSLYAKINNKEINSTPQGKAAIGVFRFLACGFAGEACTNNPNDADKNFNKSIFGYVSQAISIPYMNPPASGTYWVTNTLQDAGFIPHSYAAEGIGFASIKPIMSLWKVFRNVSYLLLVLFLIIIGFMIMFRMKINPQTVISVENTLPKIVTVLLLVTFSFPIAGFMIDMMYVLIAMSISLIGSGNVGVRSLNFFDVPNMQKTFLTASPWTIYSLLIGRPAGIVEGQTPLFFFYDFGWQFRSLLGPIIGGILDTIVSVIFAFLVFPGLKENLGINTLPSAIDDIQGFTVGIGKIVGSVLGFPIVNTSFTIVAISVGVLLVPFIIGLLFFFTILYMWAKIFFILFAAFLQIILLIIFGPLFIIMELIPGSKMGFGQWVKNLTGELIAFPVVIIISCISVALSTQQTMLTTGIQGGGFFTPPFLNGIDSKTFATLISIGLTLLIPDFIKAAKEAIGAKGIGMSAGIGMFFSGASMAGGGAMGLLGSYSSIAMAFPQLRDKLGGIFGNTDGKKSAEDAAKYAEWLKAQKDAKGH